MRRQVPTVLAGSDAREADSAGLTDGAVKG
jgi:hypothetical protein